MNIHLCLYDILVEYILKTVKHKLFMLLWCMHATAKVSSLTAVILH